MKKVYIFGHKNPDTDSVTSALVCEYLKKQLGVNCISYVLGKINDETTFVLKYFGVRVPYYLNDVKLQIKDIEYHKDFCLNGYTSLMEVHDFMVNNNTTGVAIIDDKGGFLGILTAKDLLKEMYDFENSSIYTSYDNIVKTIKGKKILKFDDEIKGNIVSAGYRSTTFIETVNLTSNDILIVADRHSIIEKAVNSSIKLLILTGNATIKKEHIIIARKNKVNIIKTGYKSFLTSKIVCTSNYAISLDDVRKASFIYENDYVDEFMERSKKLKYNNYPVLSKSGICKGLLRITEMDNFSKKKVILVDHNEESQSVIGLNEAEIVEIIDHHKIGNISTNSPINFRNMSVGSTNTILYYLYKENNIEIPYVMAGLMLSGILSDTLAFVSPTTTLKDKEVVDDLCRICNIDYKKYSKEMFEAASSIKNKSIEEIIHSDMKEFSKDDVKFSAAQVVSMNEEEILNRKDEFIKELNDWENYNRDSFVIFVITNILKNGSFILFTENAKKVLENSYENIVIEQGFFVKGLISRKKQLIPCIINNI
ncbi:MAG: putative manganese-dependent inorganic diphosphatase [Bacilli bacterium]